MKRNSGGHKPLEKKLSKLTAYLAKTRCGAGRGERGQLIAAKAEAGGKIAEVELQIIQVDQDFAKQGGAGTKRGSRKNL